MRLQLLIGVALLLSVGYATSSDSVAPTSTDIQVLSAVIAPYCLPSDGSFTVLSDKPYVPNNPPSNADIDAFAQLRHNSKAVSHLPTELGCAGVHVESQQHIDQAFKRRPLHTIDPVKIPWGGFYETYKGARQLMYISMPGYNAAGDTAMVYVSEGCGGFCGVVRVLTLRRIAGTWHVVGSQISAIA